MEQIEQPHYITDLSVIAAAAVEKEEENDHFLAFIKRQNGDQMDAIAHRLNDEVSAAIDCTSCGNCCNHLIVNITNPEITRLSEYLNKPEPEIREAYIEESLAGNCFINTVPCAFLADKKCSIYEARFKECREFPHLYKSGFKERLLGTLLHYGGCPIVYNVVEGVKRESGFYLGDV